MICKECKNKPIARGFRITKCKYCGQQCTPNCFYKIDICGDCSNKLGICQYCGNKIIDKQNDIKELQKLLVKLGYKYVPIVGEWNKETEHGVREFQRDQKIISEKDYQNYINELKL